MSLSLILSRWFSIMGADVCVWSYAGDIDKAFLEKSPEISASLVTEPVRFRSFSLQEA